MKKLLTAVAFVVAFAFIAIQFIQRPDFTNPPFNPANELRAPANVQAILDRSCSDCHSSRTRWPWYSRIAPMSWSIAEHVHEGREELSFSEFGTYSRKKGSHKLEEMCDEVKKGAMPLREYLWLHPSAKLSDADKRVLCGWSEGQRRLMAAR